jgi:hypothetical protein
LYVSTIGAGNSKARLETAVSTFLRSISSEEEVIRQLYTVSYEQRHVPIKSKLDASLHVMSPLSFDLAFDDGTLASVEEVWRQAMGYSPNDASVPFMTFEAREQMDDDEDESGL